jgi:Concanavalin A-like lectin/glucanases superfamily
MAREFGPTYGSGGGTDQVAIPNSAPPGGSITYHVRAFTNTTGGGGFGRYWQWGDDTADAACYCYYDANFNFVLGTSGIFGEYNCAAPTLDTWVDIVYTQSGTSTPSIYFDGSSQTVTTATAPTGSEVTTTGKVFRIGNKAAGTREFGGQLAEVAVWSRILGADEIGFLADGGTPDCIPGSLELYVPLIRDTINLKDNSSPTLTGTAVQPHPRVYSSAPWQGVTTQAAAAADIIFAQSWM